MTFTAASYKFAEILNTNSDEMLFDSSFADNFMDLSRAAMTLPDQEELRHHVCRREVIEKGFSDSEHPAKRLEIVMNAINGESVYSITPDEKNIISLFSKPDAIIKATKELFGENSLFAKAMHKTDKEETPNINLNDYREVLDQFKKGGCSPQYIVQQQDDLSNGASLMQVRAWG